MLQIEAFFWNRMPKIWTIIINTEEEPKQLGQGEKCRIVLLTIFQNKNSTSKAAVTSKKNWNRCWMCTAEKKVKHKCRRYLYFEVSVCGDWHFFWGILLQFMIIGLYKSILYYISLIANVIYLISRIVLQLWYSYIVLYYVISNDILVYCIICNHPNWAPAQLEERRFTSRWVHN